MERYERVVDIKRKGSSKTTKKNWFLYNAIVSVANSRKAVNG